MENINPAEISAILLQELTGFDTQGELDTKGSVLQIGDGVARVYGMRDAESGELVEFEKTGAMGIVLNLEQDNVGVVLLNDASDIKEGDVVKCTHRIASIQVGEGLLGRVVNTLGHPIDGKGAILTDKTKPLEEAHSFAKLYDVPNTFEKFQEIPVKLSETDDVYGHGGNIYSTHGYGYQIWQNAKGGFRADFKGYEFDCGNAVFFGNFRNLFDNLAKNAQFVHGNHLAL